MYNVYDIIYHGVSNMILSCHPLYIISFPFSSYVCRPTDMSGLIINYIFCTLSESLFFYKSLFIFACTVTECKILTTYTGCSLTYVQARSVKRIFPTHTHTPHTKSLKMKIVILRIWYSLSSYLTHCLTRTQIFSGSL